MTDMREKAKKLVEFIKADLNANPAGVEPGEVEVVDYLRALLGDGEPVAKIAGIEGGSHRWGTLFCEWLVHSGKPIKVGDKLCLAPQREPGEEADS